MPYNDQNPLHGGITWGDYLPPEPPATNPPKRGGVHWGQILGVLGSMAEAAGSFFGSNASPSRSHNPRIERYQPTMVSIPEVPICPVQWNSVPVHNRNTPQNIGQQTLRQIDSHDDKKALLNRIVGRTRAKNYLHALNNGQGTLYEAMYGKPDMSVLEINTLAPSIEAIVNPKSVSPSWVPDGRFEAPPRIAIKPLQSPVQQAQWQSLFNYKDGSIRSNAAVEAMQGEPLSPKAQAQFDHAMMLAEHMNVSSATKNQMNALAMAMLKEQNLQGQGTLAGGAAPASEKSSTILNPKEAYDLIQQDNYSQVKHQKISNYYTWGDVMISQSIHSKNIKTIPLNTMENATKFSKVLDLISKQVGSKVPIESWIRLNTTSYHRTGNAVDFHGNQKYLYEKVYPVVRKIAGIYGIGVSTPSVYVGLHVDRGVSVNPRKNHYKKGYQFQFIDNGKHPSTGTGGHWLKILK